MVTCTTGENTQHQGNVGHEPVVGTKDGRTESTRKLLAAALGKPANDFCVNALIGRHLFGGVSVLGIRRAAFRRLHQCQGENTAEASRQKRHGAGTHGWPTWHTKVIAKFVAPVLFVAVFGFRQLEQDVAFFPISGARKLAVDNCLCTLVGQVFLPPPYLFFIGRHLVPPNRRSRWAYS